MWFFISILVTLASLFGWHHATSDSRPQDSRAHVQARQDVHSLFKARTDSGSGPVGSAQP